MTKRISKNGNNSPKGSSSSSNKRSSNRNNNNRKKKFITTSTKQRSKHEKLEIRFDRDARTKYLTTLSSKKKERRAFGLAMQKVKDRKYKLEDKRDQKAAMLTQIEDAERAKLREQYGDDFDEEEYNAAGCLGLGYVEGDNSGKEHKSNHVHVETYETLNQFEEEVLVTTSYGIPSDHDSDVDNNYDILRQNSSTDPPKKKKDEEQLYAGNVMKYIQQIKNNLPQKKKQMNLSRGGKKGTHGAASMIGGSAQDLKTAKKTLSRVENGKSKETTKGKGKKGGKKRKR